MIKYPSQVGLIDEIGFLFSAANNPKAGNHIAQVSGLLLKLYSSSRVRYKSKSYADTDKVRSVDQPCLSILGCSTQAKLYAALSSSDVDGGLLSRFVMFDAGDNDPNGRKAPRAPAPRDVVDWVIAWNQRPLNENPLATVGMMPVIDPLKVQMTDDAEAVAMAFEVEMQGKKTAAREDGTDALYVRARENALKFALVRAYSAPVIKGDDDKMVIDQSTLIITADIMRWACELSRVTITAMEAGAKGQIADSEFERQSKALLACIHKAGLKGMTHREILQTKPGQPKDAPHIIKRLVESGDISKPRPARTGSQGRPRNVHIHRDFFFDDSTEEQAQ